MKNPYEVLGVSKSDSLDEIKKAYKKLSREYHPDRNKDEGAVERFKEINAAYQILSDSDKRRNYDTYGSENGPKASSFDFNSVFRDFFGGFGFENKSNHGEDILLHCYIDLEDVYMGGTRKLSYQINTECDFCSGKGGTMDECDVCHGHCFRIVTDGKRRIQIPCDKCYGTGTVLKNQCKNCNGSGKGPVIDKEFEFEIPRGVESGMRFRFSGLGQPSFSGNNGDLYVNVTVSKHHLFERVQGGGIVNELEVTYPQLVLGDDVESPTLEGTFEFKIPPGTQPTTRFRFRGKGLPKFSNGGDIYYGDQFIQIKLKVPEKVEGRHKELIEALFQLEKGDSD